MATITKKNLKFNILIPTYNGSNTIIDTLKSILSQTFQNFQIIIQDDASTDDTLQIIKQLKNNKIKIYQNKKNLGYSKNLEKGRKNCQGDILFLMGQDDILAKNALQQTHNAFAKSEKIGAVTRPYYWFFDTQINLPIRAKKQLNPKEKLHPVKKRLFVRKRLLAKKRPVKRHPLKSVKLRSNINKI